MGDRNLTSLSDSKFSNTTEGAKKKRPPPPTQKPIELVTSSFTALDVASLAGEMYQDSGLLIRENVIFSLYDPTTVDPNKELIFDDKNKESIEEFDYKSLSIEEKRLLLERLMKAEEEGFSPVKEEEEEAEVPSPVSSSVESDSPPRRKKKYNRKSPNRGRGHERKRSRSPFNKNDKYNTKERKDEREVKITKETQKRDKGRSDHRGHRDQRRKSKSSSPDWRKEKKRFRERSPVWR